MKQYSLSVAPREGVGRGASRRVRQSGRIPAILYGKLNPPQPLSVDAPELSRLLKQIAGSAAVIEIKHDGPGERLSIIQEIQRDPMTDRILHVDLHEVSSNAEMEIEVTVRVVGEAVGVRVDNGVLEIVHYAVRVRCLPKDLPPFIEVDVSQLRLDESIHVRELPALPGVKYLDDPNQPVISCVATAIEAEATPGEAAVAAGTEAAASAAAPAGEAKPGTAAPAGAAEKKPAEKKAGEKK